MFIVLFIFAPNWNQLKCPSTGEWIKKLVHPYNWILFSKKRNELSSHKNTWENLKCILVRKINESEKATYYVIPMTLQSVKSKLIKNIKRSMFARGPR